MLGGLFIPLKSIYNFLGSILATLSEFDEWQLSEDETGTLATQTDSVIFEFFPTVNNKIGKLFLLLCTFITIFGVRWLKFEKHLKKKKAEENLKKNDIEVVPLVLDNQ